MRRGLLIFDRPYGARRNLCQPSQDCAALVLGYCQWLPPGALLWRYELLSDACSKTASLVSLRYNPQFRSALR